MLQLSLVNFKKDTYLMIEGKSVGDRFYIIQSGRAYAQGAGNGKELLGPGDFIGVISTMSGYTQIETVVSTTDIVCVAVRRDQYSDLIQQNTHVALKIIQSFAGRMRYLNDMLVRLTLKNNAIESYDHIFDVATYYDNAAFSMIAGYAYLQYLKYNREGRNSARCQERLDVITKRFAIPYLNGGTEDMIRRYPKGSMIFSECQPGADMYVIQSGRVKISKIVDETEITLAILEKGDMFGEMALLENKLRSASAIAEDECVLMNINRKNFDNMVSTQPQLIAKLTTTLASRLWIMHRQLQNTKIPDHVRRMIDMLALQVEKNGKSTADEYMTSLTPGDIATMCGLTKNEQDLSIGRFLMDFHIKVVGGRININDCADLVKQAGFYRKQSQSRV